MTSQRMIQAWTLSETHKAWVKTSAQRAHHTQIHPRAPQNDVARSRVVGSDLPTLL